MTWPLSHFHPQRKPTPYCSLRATRKLSFPARETNSAAVMISPARPPELPTSPAQPPVIYSPNADAYTHRTPPPPTPSKLPIDFSPPLIAMVVIAAAAFLVVTYSRLISRHVFSSLLRQVRRYKSWRRRRQLRLPSSLAAASDGSFTDSPPYAPSDGLLTYSPYGLDESVIKSMPLSVYSEKNRSKVSPLEDLPTDCAVCLLEFVENDYVRTLPLCAHSFHVDCIDVWLRSHASCPLCRAGILPREWPSLSPMPFIPVMAARIRPSIDETLIHDSVFLNRLADSPLITGRRRSESITTVPEIVPAPIEIEASPALGERTIRSESRSQILKRSYSFGFERNFPSDRLVTEPATTSPWRHHNRRRSFSFWRRPSPFSSLTKSRVFSFRSHRTIRSPFFIRRRGGSLVPLSESGSIRYAHCYSDGRIKSTASPMFSRSSAAFSSSRMRCGDPEALVSPERYNVGR